MPRTSAQVLLVEVVPVCGHGTEEIFAQGPEKTVGSSAYA